MSWTSKYWDALEQLYWTPNYLGLKSISQKHWEEADGRVSVPASMVNRSGPLYRRVTTGKEFARLVRTHEETFNHIFELTFGVLDGAIANDIFCRLLRTNHSGALRSYGRELGSAFGHPKLYDVSQPDGYFVGETWTLGVELKFEAQTSVDQLAKYLLAFCVEREATNVRKAVSLAYISPNPTALWKNAFSFSADQVGPEDFDAILAGASKSVLNPLQELKGTALSVLEDLSVHSVSWSEFDDVLRAQINSTPKTTAEGRTVVHLLSGLADEVRRHPGSGLTKMA